MKNTLTIKAILLVVTFVCVLMLFKSNKASSNTNESCSVYENIEWCINE